MMQYTPLPSTAKGRETRRRILEAAEATFGTNGYHRSSVAAIANAAGVSVGTLYLYFLGKKDLLRAVVQGIGRRLRASSEPGTPRVPDREARHRAAVEFITRHPVEYRIVRECEFVFEEVFREVWASIPLASALPPAASEPGPRLAPPAHGAPGKGVRTRRRQRAKRPITSSPAGDIAPPA